MSKYSRPGSNNGRAKITIEQVIIIKKIIQGTNLTPTQIAHEFRENPKLFKYDICVSRQTISAIANGSRWSEVVLPDE